MVDFDLVFNSKEGDTSGLENIIAKTDKAAKKMDKLGDTVEKSVNKPLKETNSITDVLNKSLAKRGHFNFNKAFQFDATGASAKRFAKDLVKTEAAMKKSKKSILDFRVAMGSLSVMFMGQQIQASMTRLATTTVTAFMDISQAQSQAGQALTTLGANFTYLKFTIGNAIGTALIPLLPTIINIVEAISSFVQEHPKFTAGIVGIGIAVGGILATVGSLHLFLSGLKTLGIIKTGVDVAATTAAAEATVAANGAAAGTTWGTAFVSGASLILAGALAALAVSWIGAKVAEAMANALAAQTGAGQKTDIPGLNQEDIMPWALTDINKGQGTIEVVKELDIKTGEFTTSLVDNTIPAIGDYNTAIGDNLIGMEDLNAGLDAFLATEAAKKRAYENSTDALKDYNDELRTNNRLKGNSSRNTTVDEYLGTK